MKKVFGLLVVCALTFGLIWPLVNGLYFPMHDDTQVGRVVAMGRALRWGQFPVRWVSDLGYGYGYPIFNFYGPLPYYVGGFFYALGFSGLVATKVMMGAGMVLAGVTMFLFASSVLGLVPAVASGILYAYAPYHAVQLYIRGAVGELWTLVFFPILAWGLIQPRRAVLGGLGLGGIILSHTLLGYATALFLLAGFVLYWLVTTLAKKHDPFRVRQYILLWGIGLGVSAFFWLPAMGEMRFTGVSGQIGLSADFRNHFVCLGQLWSSPWGFGGSADGCVDGVSFMIGKLHIALGLLAMVLWPLTAAKTSSARAVMMLGFIATTLGVFLVSSWSKALWEVTPGFAYLQYPWRFLVYAVFGLSLIAGLVVSMTRGRFFRLFVCVMVIAVGVGMYSKRFAPQYLYGRPSQEFETPQELRMRVSKISDEYMPPDFIRPTHENDYVHDTITSTNTSKVRSIVETDTYSRYAITALKDEELVVKRAFFPGLSILVNGKKQILKIENGLPTISIPKGEDVVELRFDNTPVRALGNLISLVSVLGLLFIYGKKVNS